MKKVYLHHYGTNFLFIICNARKHICNTIALKLYSRSNRVDQFFCRENLAKRANLGQMLLRAFLVCCLLWNIRKV